MKISELLAKCLVTAHGECKECMHVATNKESHHLGCCLGKLIDSMTWMRLVALRATLK